MNKPAVWRSLFYKEWRECRWQMASLTAILAAVPLLVAWDDPGGVFFAFMVTTIPYVVLAAFFLGTGVAAGEQARRTAGFLQALPTPGWRPALVKLLMAMATGVAPVLVVVAAIYLWTFTWGLTTDYSSQLASVSTPWIYPGWLLSALLAPTLGLLSLTIWVAAAGVGRSDEISAGAWAVAAIGAALVAAGCVVSVFKAAGHNPEDLTTLAVASVTPAGAVQGLAAVLECFGEASDIENTARISTIVAWTLLSHGLLVRRYLRRFGAIRTEGPELNLFSSRPGRKPWLGSPRRTPFTAILWKQVRETLPVCLIGVSILIALGIVMNLMSPGHGQGFIEVFTDFVAVFSPTLGFLIAIVAGVGAFLDDLSPGLHTFWRSRPIRVDQWYWTKFFTGLCVPLLTVGGLVCGTMLLYQFSYGTAHRWGSWGIQNPLFWAATMQVLTYSGAVAAVCLVRRPLYAAVFACSAWIVVFLLVETWDVIPETTTGVGWLTAIMSVMCALVGWQALRWDVGWKR